MKRSIDIAASALGLLALCLPLLLIGAAVRCRLGGPILFRQRRPGLGGAPFWLIKFRTMTDDFDVEGVALPDSQRLTPFGKFLRATSLDELPELWNVLKGDMSLVGPRPLLMEYLELYSEEQARRHEVRPGITGWAQVNGRNALNWGEKFVLDVWYVENRSLWLDFKILLLTIKATLLRKGIRAPGSATSGKFLGNSRNNDASL